MRRGVRKILLTQLLLTVAAAFVMVLVRNPVAQPGLAAGFGGAMTVINTLLLARRTSRASGTGVSPKIQSLGLFMGVIERFVFTLVAFGLGMGFLRLDPLALLVGFAAAQLGYVAAGARANIGSAAAADELKRQRSEP